MISYPLLGVCLLSLTWTTARAQSPDHHVAFSLPRDSVTLPCGLPSIRSCSSVKWTMSGDMVSELVTAGRVNAPYIHRLSLLQDCSLQIQHPELDDARLYSCQSGAVGFRVSLQILQIQSQAPQLKAPRGTAELHCFLTTHKGYVPCNNTGMRITWSSEDESPIRGKRFRIENESECFSKLIMETKTTDHHRQWNCRVSQSDGVTASVSYTTIIRDGIEEVFAAVGESASLSCHSASPPGDGGTVTWSMGGRPLTHNTSAERSQSEAFLLNEDSSLLIRDIRALNAGEYWCSDAEKTLNKVRLHTLDVTSQCGPGGVNLTLTCVLTCSETCDRDFNVTWSERGQTIQHQSVFMNYSNILINELFLPVCSTNGEEMTCSVRREGVVMAMKKWHSASSSHSLAWLALPLGLGILCVAGAGVYIKVKCNKDKAHEESSIGMTPLYEIIQDLDKEELQQRKESKREAATTTDSFYDLLQAVN